MKRNLVICIDGTWNKPEENVSKNTNVQKIYKYLSDTIPQAHRLYVEGVGSHGNLLKRSFEGYTGTGTTKNIIKAYKFLIELQYNPDQDQLFLFGFSRGAFAVRSLAGLIRNCGVLKTMDDALIKKAYEIYRSEKKEHHPDQTQAFRDQNSLPNSTKVHFIGVWDTVGSLGNPLLPNLLISKYSKFHDTTLSGEVNHAYQALAICERRWLFSPCIWERKSNDQNHSANPDQKIEQVWFVGAHANIGGGYAKEGISNTTLLWMIDKAKKAGLTFPKIQLKTEEMYVYDETYNKSFYRFKRSERDIGLKDGEEIHTFENIFDNVLRIFKQEIPIGWQDPNYRMEKLRDYLQRKGII